MKSNVKNQNISNSVGILGLGSIGLRHARNCLEENVAVFGYDKSQVKKNNAQKYGIKVVSKSTLLEKTKYFIVCTPSSLHHDDINYLLKDAKRILVEKPFTHDYLRTKRILKNLKNIEIFTGFNLRFHSIVKKVKQILDENLLGKILWSNSIVCSDLNLWRPGSNIKKNYTNNLVCGGVIYDYSHEIDLINYFFGKNRRILSFNKNSKRLGLRVDDYASILMESKDNVLSNITMDYCCGPSIRKGIIRGIEASLFYDLINRKIKVLSKSGKKILNETHNTNFDQEYKDEIKSFFNIKKNKKTLATANDGLEVSRLINLIYDKNE